MDKIIELLLASNFFKNKNGGKNISKIIMIIFVIIYSISSIFLVLNEVLGLNIIYNIDKTVGIFSNMGILIFLLTFIAIISDGGEKLEEIKRREAENNDERLLLSIYENNGKKTIKEIKEDLIKEGINIDEVVFYNLISNKRWISTLRLKKIKPNSKKFREGYFNCSKNEEYIKNENNDEKLYDIGPFIEKTNDNKLKLTDIGREYVEKELIIKKTNNNI